MKYDATDIPELYDKARRLPDETIMLWLNRIAYHAEGVLLNIIVDLGCGTGRFTIPLHNRFKNTVFGIDPSRKMLNKATDTEGIAFIQAYAEQIPLVESAVDMVFCSQVFHHLRDKHAALDEIRRILKPDGVFCIRNSTVENLDSILHLKFFPRAYRDDHTLLPGRHEILTLIPKHGFALKGHEIVHQLFAHSRRELIDKIRMRGLSDLAVIPDTEFHEGLEALEQYATKYGTEVPVYEDMDLFVFQRA
jgi:ubiquinone/menaquinone biosynthesis C-methylase UbiE